MAGVDDLAFGLNAVAARLRELGESGLVDELRQQIGDAVTPLPDRIRQGLRTHLPDRYADTLDGDLGLTRRTFLTGAGDEARVSVYATPRSKQRKLSMSNAGFLWHPVFGDRKDWHVNQAPGQGMSAGWFDDPVEESVPEIREAVERALDNVIEKAAGKDSG